MATVVKQVKKLENHEVINRHHPIIVSGNPDLAFHFHLLVLVMKCKNSCSIFFMMLIFVTPSQSFCLRDASRHALV